MKTTEITGLNVQRTVEVVNALQQLLADFQVHYANLRHLHWFTKGHSFFIMHEKYEEFYNDAAEKIDEVAERILQLDGAPESRFSVYLKTAQVSEINGENVDNALDYVFNTLRTLISDERQVLEKASEAGDEVTVALMGDYLKAQEKTAWMLTAYNSQA